MNTAAAATVGFEGWRIRSPVTMVGGMGKTETTATTGNTSLHIDGPG